MITIIKILQPINQAYDDDHDKKVAVELAGLSTDTKPHGYANGSLLKEMDTSKTYRFSIDDDDWYETQESSGGGGGGGTTTTITTNVADGALPKGTVIPAGTTFEQYIKMRGVNDLAPTVTIQQPTTTLYEVGTTNDITFSGYATKADTDITKIEIFKDNVLIDTITSGTTFTHSFEGISSNTTLKAKATDETNSGEASKVLTFVNASYYGIESNLTKVLQTAKGSTRTYTFTNDKAVYQYPKSFGTLTSIKDSNNIEYITTFDLTEETIDGVAYYKYKQQAATTISNFKFIFA